MMSPEISKDSRVHMAIIENHVIELYQAARQEERSNLLNILRQLIQEKDSKNDLIAVGVLDWAIDRLLRS